MNAVFYFCQYMNVEHYSTYHFADWAEEITVQKIGPRFSPVLQVLQIHGVTKARGRESSVKSNLMTAYFSAAASPIDEQIAPHILFANATSDAKLIEFVSMYGPVWGYEAGGSFMGEDRQTKHTNITVSETIETLRREQWLFANVLKLWALINDTSRTTTGIQDIFCNFVREAEWPGPASEVDPFEQEPCEPWYGFDFLNGFRKELAGEIRPYSTWAEVLEPHIRSFSGDELVSRAREAICAYLSSRELSPVLVIDHESFIQMFRRAKWGVLPQLHWMLRQDCIDKRHSGVCARPECGTLFYVHRYKQRFCSEDCSRRQRQREYYVRKGKAVRVQRIARARQSRRRK
jgi:hypothetical protein